MSFYQAIEESPVAKATTRTQAEIGDLDALTEQRGKELLADLRTRGISLLPSEKQQGYLDRLLESTGLTLAEAVESAELRWIADLAKKGGQDEAGACALVEAGSYADLTSVTASELIDALLKRKKSTAAKTGRCSSSPRSSP